MEDFGILTLKRWELKEGCKYWRGWGFYTKENSRDDKENNKEYNKENNKEEREQTNR